MDDYKFRLSVSDIVERRIDYVMQDIEDLQDNVKKLQESVLLLEYENEELKKKLETSTPTKTNGKTLDVGEINNLKHHKIAKDIRKGDYIVMKDSVTGKDSCCLVTDMKTSK